MDIPNEDKTLNKRRHAMPQIKDVGDFAQYLNDEGVKVSKRFVAAKNLKPTQSNFNEDKVKSMIDSGLDNDRTIVVSKDCYIVDGHHYVIATYTDNKNSRILCYVADINIDDLLDLAHDYDGVSYKTIKESNFS